MNDNRNYVWDEQINARPEYPVIERWIADGARVIDLGCGNGSLLAFLKARKHISEFGIELAPSGVAACRQRGLNVRAGRIDVALADVADAAFDVAICNVTLQMVMYPEIVLKEMRRIARQQIISFPNFAFVLNRLDLLWFGRMPRWGLFGYAWFNTGHIHQLAINDFRATSGSLGLDIRAVVYLGKFGMFARVLPNLFAQTAIFLLQSA
ncbi:MAG: methyltransferase domain-containing protein [Chloroflexi bacterium]|nr:methyltransferase domain-containing protein [Chloroflexota bacterium]